MSECVVRMEMPESCLSCPFFNKVGCKASNRMFPDWMNVATRPKDCPIICSLPKGHGRLIDAEAAFAEIVKLKRSIKGYISEAGIYAALQEVPTIVPAEAERKVNAHDAVAPTDTPTDTPTVAAERSET